MFLQNIPLKKIIFGLIAIFLTVAIIQTYQTQYPAQTEKKPAQVVISDKTTVVVEIADTDQKITQGLSGRESLDENQGMLFVFNISHRPSFWMKDMKFPLDFIWIKDNQIVDISQNIPNPLPNTPDSHLSLYQPSKAVNYVLEVNAGFVEKNNIQTGDMVEISSN